jgi:glycerol kinase
VVWSRKTGKPLSRAIVWDDSRTRGVVAHYEHLLKTQGIKVNGQLRSGTDAAESLKELLGHLPLEFNRLALSLINLAQDRPPAFHVLLRDQAPMDDR